VRNCPEPPGGQEYFSYVVDGNFTYIKYEGCSGGYHEWFFSSFRPNEVPFIIGGDKEINKAFENLIFKIKGDRKKINFTIDDLENSIEESFNEFVNILENNNKKGFISKQRINKENNEFADSVMPTTQVDSSIIMANGCRRYVQYYTVFNGNCHFEYSVHTWICPEGVQQWIISLGCPEKITNSVEKMTDNTLTSNSFLLPLVIGNEPVYTKYWIDDEYLEKIAITYIELGLWKDKVIDSTNFENAFCNIEGSIKNQFGDDLVKSTTVYQHLALSQPKFDISKNKNLEGLQDYLYSISEHYSINNYEINDDGLKRMTNQAFTSINNYGINDDGLKRTVTPSFGSKTGKNPLKTIKNDGEPVPGAEIYIELEPDDEPIVNVITDENGEFHFEVDNVSNFPIQGTFTLTIFPTKAFAKGKRIAHRKHKVKINFSTPKNGKFSYVLYWDTEDYKTSNKGAFAVSGKNDT
jgi:hypothetical protein